MKESVTVMVVDDSKLMRRVIGQILENDRQLKVVGEAGNGEEAVAMVSGLNPDVITMDINMPVMDGLTALKHIMIKHPTPTLMLSTLTEQGADITFDALKFGAVDFVHKPSNKNPAGLEEQGSRIVKKVLLASDVKINTLQLLRSPSKAEKADSPVSTKCRRLCVIGSGEGGYATLLKIVPRLENDLEAAFLIVINESSAVVDTFCQYLDRNCSLNAARGKDGTTLQAGHCYLFSREEYVTVYAFFGEYSIQVSPSAFPERQGAVNMLMISTAERAEKNGVGVLLSGSGDDGAEGIREIVRMGGKAFVQDPQSCLYKEMPQNAISLCSSAQVVPDGKIAQMLNRVCSNSDKDS